MYRRVDDSGQQIAISPVEGRVLVSIAEAEGIPYNRGSWWATREDAQAILDAHDQLDAHNRIPDEPAPGAYLIGDRICERYEQDHPERWQAMGTGIWTWDKLWGMYGGPDVRIVALVPRPDEAAVERAARVLYNLERSNGTDWWATAAPSERAPQLVKTEAAFRAALNGGDHD